jgi:hypothetical protein
MRGERSAIHWSLMISARVSTSYTVTDQKSLIGESVLKGVRVSRIGRAGQCAVFVVCTGAAARLLEIKSMANTTVGEGRGAPDARQPCLAHPGSGLLQPFRLRRRNDPPRRIH